MRGERGGRNERYARHSVCFLNAIPERGGGISPGVIFVPNDFRALVRHVLTGDGRTGKRKEEKETAPEGKRLSLTMRS
jgi:hypothetical protein